MVDASPRDRLRLALLALRDHFDGVGTPEEFGRFLALLERLERMDD